MNSTSKYFTQNVTSPSRPNNKRANDREEEESTVNKKQRMDLDADSETARRKLRLEAKKRSLLADNNRFLKRKPTPAPEPPSPHNDEEDTTDSDSDHGVSVMSSMFKSLKSKRKLVKTKSEYTPFECQVCTIYSYLLVRCNLIAFSGFEVKEGTSRYYSHVRGRIQVSVLW
jgi:hypothetical protein